MKDVIDRIVVLDLETTGFDERRGCILEIGFVVCDLELNQIGEFGYHECLKPTATGLKYMDPTARKMHEGSGLLKRCMEKSLWGTWELEEDALAYLVGKGCQPKRTMIAGNSVHFDWRWLREHMPQLCDFFHYRLLDVSVLHAGAGFWGDAPPKPIPKHRALDDVMDSLNALRWYHKHLFKKGPMVTAPQAGSLMGVAMGEMGEAVPVYTITKCDPLVLPLSGEEPVRGRPIVSEALGGSILGDGRRGDGIGRDQGGHK